VFKYGFARELVKNSRFKRSAIAEACRIKTNTLTVYLSGLANPSKSVVALLAQTLNVPEDILWESPTEDIKATQVN
jgi:transcriptional regulator with XRE-family HTH domain